MANLIPNEIDQEDSRRDGERLVFEWLSSDEIPGTAFYSLLQKNHKHKLIGEVDFLYVCDRGLLCIEVKGGQDIFRESHKWFSKSKNGKINAIHNPFVQAKDCSYALKSYFEDTYGYNSKQARYLIGYAVVFPECRFTGDGNDLVTEVMFDGRYSVDDFGKYLNNVFDYWERLEIERHGYHPQKLNNAELRQVLDLLRGDFSVVPSMSLELQHVERKMLLLTEANISENKLIATYIYYFADSEINDQALFVQAEIDYNFETNQIGGFEIRQISCVGDGVNLHFKYDGTKFYEFDPFDEPDNQEEYDLIVSKTIAIRDEYILKLENAVKLDQDYSAEYLNAMEYAFS